MNIKTTISITEARKRIFDIAEEVQTPGLYYTFTEKGRPKAVLMSAEDFEGWLETFEVMRDFPNLKKDIDEVKRDIKSGAYKKYTTLDEYLAKHPIKQNHGISIKSKTKSRKRAR